MLTKFDRRFVRNCLRTIRRNLDRVPTGHCRVYFGPLIGGAGVLAFTAELDGRAGPTGW